jgi:hypothetical protein
MAGGHRVVFLARRSQLARARLYVFIGRALGALGITAASRQASV